MTEKSDLSREFIEIQRKRLAALRAELLGAEDASLEEAKRLQEERGARGGRVPARPAGEIEQGRHQIDQRDATVYLAGRLDSGSGHQQRHACGTLEEALLEPHAALAHHFAVIAREHDERVVGQAGALEDDGWQIIGLNDQHAFLREPPGADAPEVRDRIGIGISRPCTTFDKWRWLAVVNDRYEVTRTITTHLEATESLHQSPTIG